MAAEVLSNAGVCVELFDAMPSVGRKFLMAGKGGMNITHSENISDFISKYSDGRAYLESFIYDFTPITLREWLNTLGVESFIGTSGRVFPVGMKAAPLLRLWLHRLRLSGVKFSMRHKWLGWRLQKLISLDFLTSQGVISKEFDAVVLALGGGSWPKLGSTGEWTSFLLERGVEVSPLRPSNCGFDVNWSEYFKHKFAGIPLKSVSLSVITSTGETCRNEGELMITNNGLEGGLIYSMSHLLREQIDKFGCATIYLDLFPQISLSELEKKLSKPQGKTTLVNYFRKQLNMDSIRFALLREVLLSNDLGSKEVLCKAIKKLPVRLESIRPIDKAISSAGGVSFDSLDENLMIKCLPGIFCAGEMLKWEAPTGGYLLTACFATGRAAGFGVLNRLSMSNTIN